MQTDDDLQKLTDREIKVYYNNGFAERAERISQRINKAAVFGDSVFGFKPEVRLLVLDKDDWSKHTDFPVYGMPHYEDRFTLIIAAENNHYWDSFLPPLDQLDKTTREKVQQIYRDESGHISMIRFFDMLALHELAHAFHKQANINMQRMWLQEFFANMFMFVYIAENEPELIPVLEVFSEMIVNIGSVNHEKLSLQYFQGNYHSIAQNEPKNYGWFQSKLNVGAIAAYREAGPVILKELWEFLATTDQIANDSVLLHRMKEQMDESIPVFFENWN